jgi:hypothetical protein
MASRWIPRVELTKEEEFVLKRLSRVRTLLPFLRRHRHQLFDEDFQGELDAMYRGTGAGKEPVAPALMAMATLVQGYLNASDAMMVELTMLDLSVQSVLGRVGATKPAFSQGAFHDFRVRFIAHDMDKRLLEKTAEVARKTGEFDAKKLPKTLRVGIDSMPLEGAGRVEDTLNLLAHAGRDIARCAAQMTKRSFEDVCERAGASLLAASSIKKALDLEWARPNARDEGLRRLLDQLDALVAWVKQQLPSEAGRPPLYESLATLEQLKKQDLEPDPKHPGGGSRIKRGTAKDRRVSVTDKEMRHGRKNKNKIFNGFKQHIAADLDTELIHAASVLPANQQEQFAAGPLKHAIEDDGFTISELYIDRGYLSSSAVDEVLAAGGEVICRPWAQSAPGLFAKSDFHFDLRGRTVTCPAGVQMPMREGTTHFPVESCSPCFLRSLCTTSKCERFGRSLEIQPDEAFHEQLRRALKSPKGRERLRRRSRIEHRLAHVARRIGRKARYRGVRKNEFALRRGAAILNLEVLCRRQPPEIRSISNRSAS